MATSDNDVFKEGLSKHFATQEIKTEATPETDFLEAQKQPVVVVEDKKIENKAETSPNAADKPEDKVVLSNTKTETPETKSQEVKAAEVVKEIKVTTFEETLAERTGGKIKSWDEIEAKLNEPKIEFADEQVQKINDFIKNGGKIDKNWLYFQSTDFEKISDPFELISEAMRLEEPGITDKEIEYRIKNDYKTDDWADEEGETTEVEEVMSAKMLREAEKAKTKLKEFQQKSSFAPGQKSEVDLKKEAKIKEDAQKNWEKAVEEGVKGFDKVPVKIDEKEVFDVIVSEDERKPINDMVKKMGSEGLNVLLPKFMDSKGNIDVKLLFNYIYKAETYDNAVKAALIQGKAKGAYKEVKDLKNINFTTDGQSTAPEHKTVKVQVGEQLLGIK